jgi:hypothetical protein
MGLNLAIGTLQSPTGLIVAGCIKTIRDRRDLLAPLPFGVSPTELRLSNKWAAVALECVSQWGCCHVHGVPNLPEIQQTVISSNYVP